MRMARLLLVFTLLTLSACEQAVSERPLLTESGATPQTGLWALLEEDCPTPTGGAVQTWPECATPVWVQPGEATLIVHTPVRSKFIASAGEPRLLQVAGANDRGEPRYSYYAFKAEDTEPHRSASVWASTATRPEQRGRTALSA